MDWLKVAFVMVVVGGLDTIQSEVILFLVLCVIKKNRCLIVDSYRVVSECQMIIILFSLIVRCDVWIIGSKNFTPNPGIEYRHKQ